jgi:hypothetical protein
MNGIFNAIIKTHELVPATTRSGKEMVPLHGVNFEIQITHEIFTCIVHFGRPYHADEAPLYLMWGGDHSSANDTSCHGFTVIDGSLVAGVELWATSGN